VSESEPDIQNHATSTQTDSVFSLLSVTDQKSQNLQEAQEQTQTLDFSRIKIQQNSMEFALILRDSALNLHH